MKYFSQKIVAFFCFIVFISGFLNAQEGSINTLNYDVNKIYPAISITKENLKKANTINSFKNATNNRNMAFDPNWVKEYRSVEVTTIQNGKKLTSSSKNDVLNQEQKNMMLEADAGSDISIKVNYIPNNTMTHNDPKELYFSFVVEPDNDAHYPGGKITLNNYIKENIISNLPVDSHVDYDLSIIKFTINTEGKVTNTFVYGEEYQPGKNAQYNELLLKSIKNMPCWSAAEYADGTKVEQNYVLTVGNEKNCVIHTLNINKDYSLLNEQ